MVQAAPVPCIIHPIIGREQPISPTCSSLRIIWLSALLALPHAKRVRPDGAVVGIQPCTMAITS